MARIFIAGSIVKIYGPSAMVLSIAGVLMIAAGRPVAADTFTWNQSCPDQGWDVFCPSGLCSEEGPVRNINNWGLTSCGEGVSPPLPGAGDDVIFPPGSTSFMNQAYALANLTSGGSVYLNYILTLTGTMVINGNLGINGGGIAGPGHTIIAPGATAGNSTSGGSLQHGTLTNYGTFTFTGEQTSFAIHNGARFYNEGLAQVSTLTIWGGALVGFDDHPDNAFYNNGTFRKVNDPDGFAVNSLPFYNAGTVEVIDGWMDINGGGSSTGVFDVDSDSMLRFYGAPYTYTLNAGTTFPDTGLVFQGNGTLAVPASIAIPNLQVQSGDLNVSGVLTCPMALRMLSTHLTGGGTVNLPAGSDAYIQGGCPMDNITITNHGTVHWTNNGASDFPGSGFQLNNAGVIELNSAFAGGPGAIHNSGTVHAFNSQVSGGTFANTGLVEMSGSVGIENYTQTAGTTRLLAGASFISNENIYINGGLLEGAGAMPYSTLNSNGGVIAPGLPVGTLAIAHGFNQTAGGTVRFELGGTAEGQYDRITVDQHTSLDGTLEIAFVNGYVPQPGDSFAIIATVSRSGQFANVAMPSATCPNQPLFNVVYAGNSVTLVVTGAACAHSFGDMNGNGSCDPGDVEPFVASVLAGNGGFNRCADSNGDCSSDGRDIQSFLVCLISP